jgi:16S rRNA (adenine1518-N6/adenine1519-N6)-dimethyltransferase
MAHGRARKRFGQHFLHDPAVIARIVAAIDLKPGDAAVEIGPGQGALTQRLLEAAGRLEVVEIDRDLAALLRHRYADQPRFVLHEADALQVDWRAMAAARGARLRLIGNLPYNISTPLLFRVLEAADAILDMHFMLQREVVDRIVAAPGTAAYGRLTVMLAPRVTAQRLLDVGPGAFRPAPKVASSVVRLAVLDALPDWACAPLYGAVVAAAFGQRRKTLRNSLSRYLSAPQIGALDIDPGARAETLTPAQFGALAQAAAAVLH